MHFSTGRTRIGTRRKTGNMLTMTALCFGIAVFFCMVAFAFYMVMAQQKKGQTSADEIAISMAKPMNERDYIGQMNNVVERSRELVYISRVNDDKAQQPMNQLYKDLSAQLLNESRDNVRLVEDERKNLIKVTLKNLQEAILLRNKKAPTGKRLQLAWFETYFPEVTTVRVGCIKGVECNVENLQVIPDLKEYDIDHKYIQKGSNLYFGNINAKLPEPDNDLNFKLSALPAAVSGTVAPIRLTTQDVFVPSVTVFADQKLQMVQPDQLPGAVQIIETMDVAARETKETVRLTATATAVGALKPP
jgi:hypothetical protein